MAEESLCPAYRRQAGEWPAYWLLYVVAFAATMAHWQSGNSALALLCAAAALLGISAILYTHRRETGQV